MSTSEEKLRKVLDEKYKNVEDRIAGAVLLGFISGIIFSASSLLGFVTGFSMGLIVAKKILPEVGNYSVYASTVFQTALNTAAKYVQEKNDN